MPEDSITRDVYETPSRPGLPHCGRCSCIVLYTGDDCLFCEASREMLKTALYSLGLGEKLIGEVDIERGCQCGCDVGIVGLPTIRICNNTLYGIPQEDHLRDTLIRLMTMPCFQDSKYED